MVNPSPPLFHRIANLVAFQVGWFACVLGAGASRPWLGPAIVAGLLALQAIGLPELRRAWPFILLVGTAGAALDTSLALAGIFMFQAGLQPTWLCPPWLIAVWIIFASTLPSSLRWLAGHQGLATVLGAVAGPLSYYAGVTLGALAMPEDPMQSLIVLAVLWGLLLPSLLHVMKRMVSGRASS
jgi:hypothetical protein